MLFKIVNIVTNNGNIIILLKLLYLLLTLEYLDKEERTVWDMKSIVTFK